MSPERRGAFVGAGAIIIGWCLPLIGLPQYAAVIGTLFGLGIAAYPYLPWSFGAELEPLPANDLRANGPDPQTPVGPMGVPNWSIRDLVRHINPWLLINKDSQTFGVIALDITDRMATGQLAAWGRAITPSGMTQPLFPIPAEYWRYGKLHEWLLDDGGAGQVIQSEAPEPRAPDQTQYREIQVNRAQAISIWPNAAPTPTIQDHRAKWGELRTEGVGLRNEGITGFVKESDWIRWRGEVMFWNEAVIKAIGHVNSADAEWFRTLDEVPAPRFPMDGIFASDGDKHLHAMHDFRLKKLEKLIEDYRHK